jgi:hypothetical protein
MDQLRSDSGALFLFLYLLPGFIGLLVYDFLAEGRQREVLEKLVIAITLTLVSALLVNVVFQVPLFPEPKIVARTGFFAALSVVIGGEPGKDLEAAAVLSAFIGKNLLYQSIASTLLAAAFAALNNKGLVYKAARLLRLTFKTGHTDVWADVFYGMQGKWVRVRYDDGSQLVGWPQYISNPGVPRELFLAEATWHYPNPDAPGTLTSVEVEGPGVYVNQFDKVVAVELLH